MCELLEGSLHGERSVASVDACAIKASFGIKFMISWCYHMSLGSSHFLNDVVSVSRGFAIPAYWNFFLAY